MDFSVFAPKRKPKPEAAPPALSPEEPAPAAEPYGPYISGLDQVSQIRRLKHIELTHKRTMRMTFRKPMEDYDDDYSYSYEYPYHGYPMHGGAYGRPLAHRSMLPGPPAPMGYLPPPPSRHMHMGPPSRHMHMGPPPPYHYDHPGPLSADFYGPPHADFYGHPYGVPPSGYPHSGYPPCDFFNDGNPNNCSVM